MESNVFHDSQQADLVSNENADTKYGQDQAETHMVKLVDGKLVSTANLETEVTDDLSDRYANDEERGLNSPNQRTYDVVDIQSEHPQADMIPELPSTPDPNNPIPASPDSPNPPTPHTPGPEIPDLPSTPHPGTPEITEPSEPGRSHEVNNSGKSDNQVSSQGTTKDTPTSSLVDTMPGADVPTQSQDPAKNEELPEFLGTTTKKNTSDSVTTDRLQHPEEGMQEKPDTGTSARPYDANAKDTHDYQSAERPEETAQMLDQPKETLDESAIKKAPMQESTAQATSDMKSTDQLDRKYNDPDAAREDVI
ncbi:hypothetical protein GCM10028803_41000 [Larkinella knui]|uniref:Uncharacterized protein n=1 Tax=Larkinella knui TaxID=2025310 RepID=A0A3P1CN26_9BACT|nr:hypothetical protein [Larkinella knui]RRB14733.1 hypothetical protein EHT87_09180 [Larkinella knui]